jgi:pyruvate kinase
MDLLDKKTKIVATIGPATSSVEQLTALIREGVNVLRLNFSHGSFDEHQVKVDNARTVMKKTGMRVAIMQDLGGPKIRIGDFKTESITLKEGQTFTITTDDIVGDETRVSTNYKPLPRELKVGGVIKVHDGKKKLEIMKIKGNDIICKVIIGGDIKGRRGINLPGAHLSIASLTDKDKKDIAFGLKNKVDYFAFSFVRRPSDVLELREILKKAKSDAQIIAKVEDCEALENIDALISLVDAVMIGRGDFAIEIEAENMPLVQKMIIEKCNAAGKPVITATQMLESMINTPVPTRAEVSDVANAILEGTDAVMLSEETALGKYPVEAVQMMTKIAKKIDPAVTVRPLFTGRDTGTETITDAVSAAVVGTACDVGAKLIFATTETGFTARMISRYKPEVPVIAFTPSERVANQLLLSRGVIPVVVPSTLKTNKDVTELARKVAKEMKLASKGDLVVITGGAIIAKKGTTNSMFVEIL